MQSKRFRNEQFCVGDLVAPNWNPKEFIGLGLILEIQHNRWNEPSIIVYWQGTGITKEAPVDLNLLQQALD
jgi:hypothetical protein